MAYNYRERIKARIEDSINHGDYDISEYIKNGEYDECYERLYDDMWADDNITGNGSGSYTFSRYEAEENLCHNFDLAYEAAEDFGITPDFSNPEGVDVLIRCYLLGECIGEVLDYIFKFHK